MGIFSLGEAMEQFLRSSRINGGIQALRIEEVWEELMGKTIGKYTEKISIHGHTLYITTTIAPLRQELLYQKENIILRVNEKMGEGTVKEVVIR
jgi:predicted nucleic acid-binding Zn ribbon protein